MMCYNIMVVLFLINEMGNYNMKRKNAKKVLSFALAAALAVPAVNIVPNVAKADNPIVQTYYTADPSPMVVGDTLYLITSHDEDVLEPNNATDNYDFYTMKNWKCYSTKDMINWTDHGSIFGQDSFSWGHQGVYRAWASQCVERNGKFYLYVPILRNDSGQPYVTKTEKSANAFEVVADDVTVKDSSKEKKINLSRLLQYDDTIQVGDYVILNGPPGYGIGVAVADTPYGPYEDAIGEPLIKGDWNDIDPTVYIDDDGQAYLFYGQTLKYCLLNDDMISLKTNPTRFNVPNYVEGPWFTKHENRYYFMWAANGGNVSSNHKGGENIQYAYCDEPLGDYTYGGILQETTKGNCFTNHPGVCDFKGHSYLFYHTNELPAGGSYHRSVGIAEFKYNDDGTIDVLDMPDSVGPIGTLNPFDKTEAETICYEEGVKTGWYNGTPITGGENLYVYNMHDEDYILVRNADFGNEGAVSFKAAIKDVKADADASIEIYSDDELVGTLKADNTSDAWKETTIKLDKKVTGVHDIKFVFKGSYEKPENETDKSHPDRNVVSAEDTGMFKFDYWQFEGEKKADTTTPSGSQTTTNVSTGSTDNVSNVSAPVTSTVDNEQTNITAPGKTKIISKKGLKKKIKLKWKKVKGASGYTVKYSLSKNFKKNVKSKSTKKTSVTLKKLKSDKYYYVKIAAYSKTADKDKLYAKYTAAVKIKTK